MHHVRLQFVTSTTSKELLKEIVHIKCDLVAKCSTYLEAIQAIYGFYIIISIEDQSRIDLVKHTLQKQWARFIMSINIYHTYHVYKWRQNLLPKITNDKSSSLKRAETKHQKMLRKKEAKQTIIEERGEKEWIEVEKEESDEYLVEEILVTNPQLRFLLQRFQNSNKNKRARTHRRQHIMALGMVA